MAKYVFGGIEEDVVTREEFPLERARQVLRDEVVAVLGYGVQGPAQALNMRDNGIRVIVGQRKGSSSWERAIAEGWSEGETLFTLEEAAERASVVQFLVSDAGQKTMWPAIRPRLQKGIGTVFFPWVRRGVPGPDRVIPPFDVDVILVAPKGSGRSVRANFLDGSGINSSYAVYQDYTGRALERTLALGMAVGSGYLFPTTFENEVYSDLTGERGVLMGALAGVMEAQYEILRKNGHSPSEAFNETVEELTQSLIRLVAQNGMDWMYANCSTTAQRGALDWKGRFHDAVVPVFEELYKSVRSGEETRIALAANGAADYKNKLETELKQMRESEMWRAGKAVRALRPENWNRGSD